MQAGLRWWFIKCFLPYLKCFVKNLHLIFLPIKIHKIAASIGSDCPFFIENKTVYAHNIGTDFEDIDFDLSKYYIKIVKANVSVSTQEAYSGIIPKLVLLT